MIPLLMCCPACWGSSRIFSAWEVQTPPRTVRAIRYRGVRYGCRRPIWSSVGNCELRLPHELIIHPGNQLKFDGSKSSRFVRAAESVLPAGPVVLDAVTQMNMVAAAGTTLLKISRRMTPAGAIVAIVPALARALRKAHVARALHKSHDFQRSVRTGGGCACRVAWSKRGHGQSSGPLEGHPAALELRTGIESESSTVQVARAHRAAS